MARLVAAHGLPPEREETDSPFLMLARSIVFQQLSGKAAGTIFRRFVALFDPAGPSNPPETAEAITAMFPTPAALLAKTDEELRSAGISRQKAAALRSLSEHFLSGELGSEAFDQWDDEEIITHLTRVRGIGRWSAEMFLMFQLGRPDVLPVNDVGVNRAIMKLYGLGAMPKPAEVLRIGESWHPFASPACWYLWQSEDVPLPAE
jgi:DNA-3-methyladenine glycosylase II